MKLRRLRAALAVLALGILPAAAQTPPKGFVPRVNPGATSTSAPVEIQDGSGQWVPLGTLNPSTHAFVPQGLPTVSAAAAAAQATANAAVKPASDAGLKSLQLAPAGPLGTYGLGLSRALAGSYAGSINASLHNITSDNAALSGSGSFLNSFTVQHLFGGSTVTGGRQAHYDLLMQTASTSGSNTNRNYVAHASNATTQSGDGGTDTGAGALGAYFAENPVAVASSGAKNLVELTAGEANIAAQTGSSMKHKAAWSIVARSDDAVQGAVTDAMLLFGAQAGAIGFRTGILFDSVNGQFPIASNGTVLRSAAGTVYAGIDLSALTISGTAIATPGFNVDGTGNITGGTLSLTGSPTVNAGVPIKLKGPNGDPTAGTTGAQFFTSSVNLYLDAYDPGSSIVFRGSGYGTMATFTLAGLTLPAGLIAANLPTAGGTAKGTLCVDTSGTVYVKTTTGACL